MIRATSLLFLDGIALWLKTACFAAVIGLVAAGILNLALQNLQWAFWTRNRERISMALNAAGALLFIAGLQPYAAVLLFVFLAIKALMMIKWP